MLKNYELAHIVGGARYAKNIIIDYIRNLLKRALVLVKKAERR